MKVTPGYIYVLKEKNTDSGPLKVGETADLDSRLKTVLGQSCSKAEYCRTWYIPVQGGVDKLFHTQLEIEYPGSRVYSRDTGAPTEWFHLRLEQIEAVAQNLVDGLRNKYEFDHTPRVGIQDSFELAASTELSSAPHANVFFSKPWKVGKFYLSLTQILTQLINPKNTVYSRWAKRHGIELLQAFGQQAYFRFNPQLGSSLAKFANDELFKDLPKAWVFSMKNL